MAFLVEDGTGLTAATSYVSVAAADTYHTAHGAPATWTAATTATKEAALMAATVYMDAVYTWVGSIAVDTQALGWPRVSAVDAEGRDVASTSVPAKVADACAYLANQHLTTPLTDTYTRGDGVKRQKVGPLEIEYNDSARPGTWMPYAKQIIQDLITNVAGQATLTRA